jgi:two-component system sensor histidine kinase/response regulator
MLRPPRRDKSKVKVYLWDQMVLIGFGLAVFYYIFDSILYIFLNYDVDFLGRLLGPDMSAIWSRLTILCLFVIFGSHAQFTINQRKYAEAALRGSEEKYRTIIESTEDGYYEVDMSGNLLFFHDALCSILGHSREELSGMNRRMPLGPGSNRAVLEAFSRVYRSGQPAKSVGWTFVDKIGETKHVESSVSLLRDTRGEPAGFSGFLRDVTERKQAEALEKEKLAAEAANRAKSDFIARMSHEIRTPLSSIIGMTEILLESGLKPQQREDLDVVHSAAYALLALINNVLDFSKIEAGKLEIEEIAFNPRDVLGESLRIMAMKCHEKGLELACRVDPGVPDILYGDPTRLRQVILNLVDNAYKFTDTGEVVVHMAREQSQEAGRYLHVSVRDTGIGIAVDKQSEIFKAFAQADAAKSRRYGGAGLGLSVSSQLVKMMGGRMWVESEPNRGCTINFTARFRGLEASEPPADPIIDSRLHNLRVLVVEDNSTSLKIVMEMLDYWRMKPLPALGIEEAKQVLLQSRAAGEAFDLILLDSSMPGDGGLKLARWIKQREFKESRVILMLTFDHQRSDLDFGELGVTAGLTKPIRSGDLLGAMARALAVNSPPTSPQPEKIEVKPERFIEPLKILVAEDTPFNQKFIQRLLERWEHSVTLVENGRQVLDKLPAEHFDLILMDVQMPEMDGYEATRTIRRAEQNTGRHIPIVAMTAHAIRGDREKCLEAGMDDYLSKPISSSKLMEIIEKIAWEKAEGSGKVRSVSTAGAADVTLPRGKTGIVDRNMLKDAFDGDWVFFKEIVDLFTHDYPPMIAHLLDAAGKKDAAALRRNAHSIKGMVRLFKADEAARLAIRLENKGRASDFTDVQTDIETLDAALGTLKDELLAFAAELPAGGAN